MRSSIIVRAALSLALVSGAGAARADVIPFTGSMSGLGVTGPDATCAPFLFRGAIAPESTIGSSTIGDFTYSHSICLSGPGPSAGTFLIDFGDDTFEGSLTGLATPSATPGISNTLFNYTILGGTGLFLGATGSFTGTGTADARQRPAIINLAFTGAVTAVPEPGTWGMMLLGFGLAGAALRRRRPAGAVQRAF